MGNFCEGYGSSTKHTSRHVNKNWLKFQNNDCDLTRVDRCGTFGSISFWLRKAHDESNKCPSNIAFSMISFWSSNTEASDQMVSRNTWKIHNSKCHLPGSFSWSSLDHPGFQQIKREMMISIMTGAKENFNESCCQNIHRPETASLSRTPLCRSLILVTHIHLELELHPHAAEASNHLQPPKTTWKLITIVPQLLLGKARSLHVIRLVYVMVNIPPLVSHSYLNGL